MNNKNTLGSICDCTPIEKPEYPLQIWFNEVIQKRIEELSVLDELRILRQNMFVEEAMPKIIRDLKTDPFIGELRDGELLEKIADVDPDILLSFKKDLLEVVKFAHNYKHFDWILPEQCERYVSALDKLEEKINKK